MNEDEDFALAIKLFDELNKDNNTTTQDPSTKKLEDMSIVDPSWELIDPVPDIRQLFVQFNGAFFDGLLAGVEVKWSSRMTLYGFLVYELFIYTNKLLFFRYYTSQIIPVFILIHHSINFV